MIYRDLRDFVAGLETCGELVRVREPVSARLEMLNLLTTIGLGNAMTAGEIAERRLAVA